MELYYLKSILRYNPETGNFTWLVKRKGCKLGSIAGCKCGGRVLITIDGHKYKAHRLAWFYMKGEWPEEVDHFDRNPLNNKLVNLRKATRVQNAQNMGVYSTNTSGHTGMSFRKDIQKWRALIRYNGSKVSLGCFNSKEEAIDARKSFERRVGWNKF